jgi:hypothetical protein
MQIETQNELAALILGVRLGGEHMLNFYDVDGQVSIDDDGCEGWCVKLGIDGKLWTDWCADDEQEEELDEVIRKAQEQAKQIHKRLKAGG